MCQFYQLSIWCNYTPGQVPIASHASPSPPPSHCCCPVSSYLQQISLQPWSQGTLLPVQYVGFGGVSEGEDRLEGHFVGMSWIEMDSDLADW